jgi:hypothetical protein
MNFIGISVSNNVSNTEEHDLSNGGLEIRKFISFKIFHKANIKTLATIPLKGILVWVCFFFYLEGKCRYTSLNKLENNLPTIVMEFLFIY